MNRSGDKSRRVLSPERAEEFRFQLGYQAETSILGLLSLGLIAGLFGPYFFKNYEDSIWCLRAAALSYWGFTIWACLLPRWIDRTLPTTRRWRKVLAVAAIAGVPALAPFTSLLETFRDHPKLFGLASCLFYLFANVVLGVAWFMATNNPISQEPPETTARTM